MPAVQLAPSILTADFGRLADEARAAETGGADMLHLDVMDRHFVPNITFGRMVVEALRKATSLPFDLHLIVEGPAEQLEVFDDFVDTINVHIEVSLHINRTVDVIHKPGNRAGVCLNLGPSLSAVEQSLPDVEQLIVMTINLGWGGQQMLLSQLAKVQRLRAMLDEAGLSADIEIDGGVKLGNAADCVSAGANVLVYGSSVYNNDQSAVVDNLAALRKQVDAAAVAR